MTSLTKFSRRASLLLAGAFALQPFTALPANAATYKLRVDGLACPFCAYGIEKQLKRIKSVRSVTTDIKAGVVVVKTAAGATISRQRANRAVVAAGFTLRGFSGGGN